MAENRTSAALTQAQATDAANIALTISLAAATQTHNDAHAAQAAQTQALASAQSAAASAQTNASTTAANASSTLQAANAALQAAWQAAIAIARDLQTQNLAVANAANAAAMASSIQTLDSALTAFQIAFDQAQPATAFANVATPGFLTAAASFWLDAVAGVQQNIRADLDNVDAALQSWSQTLTAFIGASVAAAQVQFNALDLAVQDVLVQTATQSAATWNYLQYDFNIGVRAQGLLRAVSGLAEFLAGDAAITASGGLAVLTAGLSAPASAIGVLGGAVTAVHGLDQLITGLQQMYNGVVTPSVTEQLLQRLFVYFGQSEQQAAASATNVNNAMGVVLSLGSSLTANWG